VVIHQTVFAPRLASPAQRRVSHDRAPAGATGEGRDRVGDRFALRRRVVARLESG